MKITTREQAIAVLTLADTVSAQVDAVNNSWPEEDDAPYARLDAQLALLSDTAAELRAMARRALGGAA